jgi:hypothetical protein
MDSGQTLHFNSSGGPFQLLSDISGRPLPSFPNGQVLKKCVTLEIHKVSIPESDRLFAFQSEHFIETQGIWKTGVRFFRLKGKVEDLPNGLLLTSRPIYRRKQDDRTFVWSAYPLLYPFSAALDIVTSPLQLVSILAFGFGGHLYLSGCLIARKCKTALG